MARAMKDSGIEWIGKIPESWELKRMKSCIIQRDSGSWGEEPIGSDGDTICLRIADFDYSLFRFKNTDPSRLTFRHYDIDTISKLHLEKNDILIEKSGGGEKTPVGRTVVFDKEYNALFANFMDRLRCASFIEPLFMQYVFVTFYKNEYTRNYIKQTTGIQNLDLTSMLAKECVSVPPIEEQERIAEFLDKKCGEIDEVIAKTEKTIEEYKALKQSVITEAVTKGIRPNRPMKDSGIEWIDQIPEEWELSRIKYVSDFQPTCDMSNLTEESIITYTPMENIKCGYYVENTAKLKDVASSLTPYCEGDIVLAKVTPCFENGNIAIMNNLSSGFGLGSSELFVFRPKEIVTKYLFYWLRNNLFISLACSTMTGTGGLKRVSPYFVKNFEITYPKILEQKEIADYLDTKCTEIDKLIEAKQQLLTELEAYKKSVIYEYVTGKKEV